MSKRWVFPLYLSIISMASGSTLTEYNLCVLALLYSILPLFTSFNPHKSTMLMPMRKNISLNMSRYFTAWGSGLKAKSIRSSSTVKERFAVATGRILNLRKGYLTITSSSRASLNTALMFRRCMFLALAEGAVFAMKASKSESHSRVMSSKLLVRMDGSKASMRRMVAS